MANYSDLSYNLGLRKLAGLRSVAPAIVLNESSQDVYYVQQGKQIYLTGCEMTTLQADCLRISYKQLESDPYTIIKNYLTQTTFSVADTYDDTNNTNLISTKISATPVMNKRKFGNENSFRYSFSGSIILEEFDTYTGSSDSLMLSATSEYEPIAINNYNFSRSFVFKAAGIYKFELDETASTLYRQIGGGPSITNPDNEANYNNYKTTTRGPWQPVDYSKIQNGSYLKREIIVKCVNNYDPILQSPITPEVTENITTQTLDAYTPTASTNRRKFIRKDLIITGKQYDPTLYEKYCIETSSLSNSTFNSTDKQITTTSSSYKNLRNGIFSDLIFSGNDLTNFVKVENPGGVTTTIDMRNTVFKNCTFKNIIFGTRDFKQLIMDGSVFESCEFYNCRFFFRPKNILFKNCKIFSLGNLSSVFNINGSDGNVFIDLVFDNCDQPFLVSNTNNLNNLNNLFYRVISHESPNLTNRASLIKVNHTGSTPGVFVGNIFLMNYISRSSGDPVVIESSSSLNLFTMNYFDSSGCIKLGK